MSGETIDVGYVHVSTEAGECIKQCPHPDHAALCPRCGADSNGVRPPSCADDGYTHAATCATYTHTADVCDACKSAMGDPDE